MFHITVVLLQADDVTRAGLISSMEATLSPNFLHRFIKVIRWLGWKDLIQCGFYLAVERMKVSLRRNVLGDHSFRGQRFQKLFSTIVRSFRCKMNTSQEEALIVLSLLLSSSYPAPKRGISGACMSMVEGDSFILRNKGWWKNFSKVSRESGMTQML